MKIAITDRCTITRGDIDFSPIEALGEVCYYDRLTHEQLVKAAEDVDILLVNKAEVSRDVVAAARRLKYVGTFATGFNNIDLAALNERGIICSNVPDYSTGAVCQHVFSLLLMLCGNTEKYAASVADGGWIKSRNFCYIEWPMHELHGKTFGVYGYGNIGRAVAKVAEAFGMHVIVHTRTVRPDCPYENVSGKEIFEKSDVLSFHCPLNGGTAGIINANTLALMKKDAIIINTARGGLADEKALAEALNSGRIGGAGLDTLIDEPMSADCPLIGARNCIITPHIAWAPIEARHRLVKVVAENIAAFLAGKPQNVVNRA